MRSSPNDKTDTFVLPARHQARIENSFPLGVDQEFLQERILRLCQPRLSGAVKLLKQFDSWIDTHQKSLEIALKTDTNVFNSLLKFREAISELIPLLEKPDLVATVKTILLFSNLPFNNFEYQNPKSEAIHVTSKIPVFLTAQFLFATISQYERSISSIDQFDPTKVLTAFALGAKIPNFPDQLPNFEQSTAFRVLVNLAQTHSRSVYLKADLISEIEKQGVNIKKSDRSEVEKANLFDSAKLTLNEACNYPEDYLKASKAYIESRRALLDQGPIYLKPIDGAGGVGVLKVERTEKGLVFQGDQRIMSFLEMAAKGIFSNQRAVMPENNFFESVCLNQLDQAISDYGELLIDLRDRTDLKPELQELFRVVGYISGNQDAKFLTQENGYYFETPEVFKSNIIYQIEAGRYQLEQPSYDTLAMIGFEQDFISNCKTTLEQDGVQFKLTVQVSPEEEANLFHQIDLMMLQQSVMQYAEQAIEAPKFNNHSVEVRVINFDGKPFAHYCKVALEEGSIVNNVSQGGTSAAFSEVLQGIYSNILEGKEREKLSEKLAWTIAETNRNATVGASAAETYFTEQVTKELSGLIAPKLLEDIRLRTCSTDFMFEVIAHEVLGKVLSPVMIDSNLAYAFSGLESVDLEAHLALKRKLHRIRFADPLEHIESLYMQMLID